MVRLISKRRMKLGALLVRAEQPSAPMPRAHAEALIAKDKLARLWHAKGLLRIVDADAAELRVVQVDEPGAVGRAFDAMVTALDLAENLSPSERDDLEARLRAEHARRFGGAEGEDDQNDEGADNATGAGDEPAPSDTAEAGSGATGSEQSEPTETPAPEDAASSASESSPDPWDLNSKNRDELREIARELKLDGKVDLRLGEDRLREALRAAITAEG